MSARALTPTCMPADGRSAQVITILRKLVSDPEDLALRTDLGVPVVPPSQVMLIANDAVCVSAAKALDELAEVTASGRRVYVVKVGSVYVVVDPRAFHSPRTGLMIFDTRFTYKSTLLL